MRKIILSIIYTIIISSLFIQNLLADTVFLNKITVKGNRITKTSYIMQKVNLVEGKNYDVDKLMKKMSEIKSKLLDTGLFESVFFDDELDQNGNLNLTIKVKEKNYLFFGPEGSIYYKNKIEPDISVYLEYTNLLGENNKIKVSFPIYENRGAFIKFESDDQKKLIIGSSIDIKELKSDHEIAEDYLTGNIYLLYNLNNQYRIGSGFIYNRYTDSSFILYPLITMGSPEMKPDRNRRLYSKDMLKIGYGENNKLIYGLSSSIYFYKDLFLQIIFKMGLSFDYLEGNVPENLKLYNTSRGYPEHYISGDKRISPRTELYIPLQWFPNLAVSLFVDSDIIGYNNLKFIAGGGLGIRWFNKYQNPLIIDFAFGRGFHLNLSKKI